MTDSRWRWTLLGLALFPRLIAAVALGNGFQFVDEAEYFDAARRLGAGLDFAHSYRREPAYPVVLALLSWPLPADVVFLRMAQALVGALGCLLTFELGRRTFGRTPGLLAAVLYALDPLLVITAAVLYSETVAAIVLLVTLLAALHGWSHDRLWSVGLAGVLLGVLTLLRPVAMVIFPVLLAWIAFARVSPRRRVLCGGVTVLLYFAPLAPWTYRNYQVHGHLVPISGSGEQSAPVLAKSSNNCGVDVAPGACEEEAASQVRSGIQQRGLTATILHQASEQPYKFVMHIAVQFRRFWELYPTFLASDDADFRTRVHSQDPRMRVDPMSPRRLRDWVSIISFGPELLLALLGIVIGWRRWRWETVLFVAVLLSYSLGYSLFFSKLRYRVTILPELFLFSGVTAAALAGAATRRVRRHGSS